MGQLQIAYEFLKTAATVAVTADLDDLVTMIASEIAAVCKDARNYADAIVLYQRILEKIARQPNPHLEGRIIAALGRVLLRQRSGRRSRQLREGHRYLWQDRGQV
jgi:hypothetical protein